MTLAAGTQDLLDKLHEHGYWRVVIRPTAFQQDRIPLLKKCEEIVASSVVNLRGQEYPDVTGCQIIRGNDWIEASVDRTPYLEYWRLFQSGQFIQHHAFYEDWGISEKERQRISDGAPFLRINATLYRLTEIFEFAARLARWDVLDPAVEIGITLYGTKGRRLVFMDPERFFEDSRWESTVETITYPSKVLPVIELRTRTPDLALDAAEWIFERFNCDVPRSLLSQSQQRLLQRNL